MQTTIIMRIFLIGFMASGKSHLGKELARLANLPFLDLDELIVQRSGLSIAAWFEQRGEDAFRQYESQQLQSVAEFPNLILACGGGTPCFYNNMQWMNEQGLSILLDVPTAVLFRRLRTAKYSRPLVADLTEEELEKWINERLSARLPYYQQAAISFSDDTAARLYDELHARGVL